MKGRENEIEMERGRGEMLGASMYLCAAAVLHPRTGQVRQLLPFPLHGPCLSQLHRVVCSALTLSAESMSLISHPDEFLAPRTPLFYGNQNSSV